MTPKRIAPIEREASSCHLDDTGRGFVKGIGADGGEPSPRARPFPALASAAHWPWSAYSGSLSKGWESRGPRPPAASHGSTSLLTASATCAGSATTPTSRRARGMAKDYDRREVLLKMVELPCSAMLIAVCGPHRGETGDTLPPDDGWLRRPRCSGRNCTGSRRIT